MSSLSLIKSYQVLSSLIKSYQVLSSQYNVQFVKTQILKASEKTKQEAKSFFTKGKTILKSSDMRFATKRKLLASALYQIRTRFEHGFSLCNEVLLQVNSMLVLSIVFSLAQINKVFVIKLPLRCVRQLLFLRLQLSFLRRQESRPTSTRTPLDSRLHGNDRVWSFLRLQLSFLRRQESRPTSTRTPLDSRLHGNDRVWSFLRQSSFLRQLSSFLRQLSFPRRRESRMLLSSDIAWFYHLFSKLSLANYLFLIQPLNKYKRRSVL